MLLVVYLQEKRADTGKRPCLQRFSMNQCKWHSFCEYSSLSEMPTKQLWVVTDHGW
jgi:hypothetical protein